MVDSGALDTLDPLFQVGWDIGSSSFARKQALRRNLTSLGDFTYGQDSEAGFASDFAEAAQGAAFVTITTSPQTYTVDLAAAPSDAPGRRGPGFGPGRFH